jgi:Arc/MetJ family transcription regulator
MRHDQQVERISPDLDQELLDTVMIRFGLHTRAEAIDLVLRHVARPPAASDTAPSWLRIGFNLEPPVDRLL